MHASTSLITRPRLLLALIMAILIFVCLPLGMPWLDRTLIAWNGGSWLYLLTQWILMLRATPARIRCIARTQNESAVGVVSTVCIGVVMSLLAIGLELTNAKNMHGDLRTLHLLLPASTLIAAWLLVPTLFALHYAHLFYSAHKDMRPFLFPDRPRTPDYWDFAYFSFNIAVASQTADVILNNSTARRLVLAQSIVAFVFNTSLLALSINVAASLLN